MHEATFKLVLTQKQYVDRSYWVVATNYWWIVGNFKALKSIFIKSKNALSEGVIEYILIFCHNIVALF